MNDLGPYYLGFPATNGLVLWSKPRMMSAHAGVALVNPVAGSTVLVPGQPGYQICIDNYSLRLEDNAVQAVAGQNPISFMWGALPAAELIAAPWVPAVAAINSLPVYDSGHVSYTPAMLAPGSNGGGLPLNINFTFAVTCIVVLHLGWHYERY
jgi:hypothetical protein